MDIAIPGGMRTDTYLLSESLGRLIVTVAPGDREPSRRSSAATRTSSAVSAAKRSGYRQEEKPSSSSR